MKTTGQEYINSSLLSIDHGKRLNYQQLLKNLPVAIYTCNNEGYITFYNNNAVELWGREPEIGTDLWCGSWKIYRPDGSPLPLDTCPMAIALKEKRTVTGEEIVVERPDGRRIHVIPHPQPIFDSDGNLEGAINILVDITERKRAEQQMREGEERFRMAVAATKLGTWDFDPLTGHLTWSEECKKIYDFHDDVEVNYALFSKHIYPDDAAFVHSEIARAMNPEGDGNYDIEYRIVRYSDQQVRWIRAQGKVFFNAGREPVRFIGTVLDITDERGAKAQLEKTVYDRTRELMQLNEQLERSNNDLEQFAYIASHDLQEPLRKLQTYSELLRENFDNKETSEKYYNKITASARRMSELIRDVLDYSRLSGPPEEFTAIDLNEVLQEVKTDFDVMIEQRGASIQASALPVIKGNALQWRQLFGNLISNSLKFCERNPSISITSRTLYYSYELRQYKKLAQAPTYAELVFRDNGIGFDQQYAEQIFVIFQRLNNAHDYNGTGIGLALCRKIVENHGGIITAASQPGEGATFTIVLPMIEGNQGAYSC
jgi:PAS domain S-box-containing protein